ANESGSGSHPEQQTPTSTPAATTPTSEQGSHSTEKSTSGSGSSPAQSNSGSAPNQSGSGSSPATESPVTETPETPATTTPTPTTPTKSGKTGAGKPETPSAESPDDDYTQTAQQSRFLRAPVIPEEPEGFIASNVNMEACCPCIPLAQVEVRLGLTSYAGALSWYTAAYGLLALALAGLWIFVALWIYSQAYRDATSVLVRILWILASLALAAVPSLLLVRRIATLRSTVRERFDIPGSVREDRTAAWQETARAIRQMRRHLKIDQAKGGAVATLPAYVMRRMDGVLPTALEGLKQRRETSKRLQEIDKLLRDDQDEFLAETVTAVKATRGCSFGSGRNPKKNARYWLHNKSFVPGPGAYAVSKADRIVKPCECKKPQEQVEIPAGDLDGMRQDTKQPRRASPSLVAYSRPASDTEPLDFQTREQQRRVAASAEWEQEGRSPWGKVPVAKEQEARRPKRGCGSC
ncbi:hypothetical protein JG688_00016859, partial [Phytophthora aleatoria]